MSAFIEAPLHVFDLAPGDPWLSLVAEAEHNTARAGRLPPMLIAYAADTRIAVGRADLKPEEVAAVEALLLGRPSVRWTACAGEVMLSHGGGMLRHAYVRGRWPQGRWQAAVRPFVFGEQGLTWLGRWRGLSGDRPEGTFFPDPSEREVRFSG